MRRSVLPAGIAAVGVIAATAVGATLAFASSPTPTEHFTFLSSRSTGARVLVAQGPIHALGKDVTVSNRVDRLEFPAGNLVVRHYPTGPRVQRFDKTPCYARYREFGTYRIVRGTGAYRGTTGHGTYRLHVRFVECHPNKARVYQLMIIASGPLRR